MKPIKKKFDAVKMMRSIRDRLSKKYIQNPASLKKDLERINKKYGITSDVKKSKSEV
jgi:hypothetical protein